MSSHRHFKSKAFTVNLIILGSSLAEIDQYTAGKNWPRLLRSSEFDRSQTTQFVDLWQEINLGLLVVT